MIEMNAELAEALGQWVTEKICEAVGPLKARVKELEMNIAELQNGATKFCGVWQRANEFRRGSLTVHDGGLWAAIDDVPPNMEPGVSRLWQLCVKSAQSQRPPSSHRPNGGSVVERRS
jgi:hypothetical protein